MTVDHETYYQGIGEMQRIITGKGTFYGDTAISDFQRLAKLFEEQDPGNLEHPQWENCVSYQFKFTQAKTNGEVPF